MPQLSMISWDGLSFNPEKLIEVLKNKIEPFKKGYFKCAVCEHNVLNLGSIVELRTWNDGVFVEGAPTVPAVSLQCDRCGHIQLHSAIKLGLVNMQTGKIEI